MAKCRLCPSRKHCWDVGNCDGCDFGKKFYALQRKIDRLKKKNAELISLNNQLRNDVVELEDERIRRQDEERFFAMQLGKATDEIHKLIYFGPLKGSPATRVSVCHSYNWIIHKHLGVRADGGCFGCSEKKTCRCDQNCEECPIAKKRREKLIK